MGYRLLAGSPALADSLVVSCSLQKLPRSVFIIITQSIKICVDFLGNLAKFQILFLWVLSAFIQQESRPAKNTPPAQKSAPRRVRLQNSQVCGA